MRRILFFLIPLFLITTTVYSQTYTGVLTTGSYSQKGVCMEIKTQGKTVTLEMRRVRFAKLMPVKVDVEVKGLKVKFQGNNRIVTGENIIPLNDGKPRKKHKITEFKGVANADRMAFECKMGDKKVSFTGQRNFSGKSQHTMMEENFDRKE